MTRQGNQLGLIAFMHLSFVLLEQLLLLSNTWNMLKKLLHFLFQKIEPSKYCLRATNVVTEL